MAKLVSKFTRVALEGDTIDGRKISRQQIEQMGRNYDPKTYAARINLEHFRGIFPDGAFPALGDVVAAKSEAADGKLGLYARLAPLPELVKMNQAGQKLHTSIEMLPDFAGTGEAYLVGLAVTDSPASLGTEPLSFSCGAKTTDCQVGATHEIELEFTEQDDADPDKDKPEPSVLSKIKELLSARAPGERGLNAKGLESAVEAMAEKVGANDAVLEGLRTQLKKHADALAEMGRAHDAFKSEYDALAEKLSTTTNPNQPPRTPAAGGNGEILIDF